MSGTGKGTKPAGNWAKKSWADDTMLTLSAAIARSEHYRQQKAALERGSRRLNDYELWQRGLIQMAEICARKAEREKAASEARRTAKRERRKIAARLRRAGKTPKPSRHRAGSPKSVELQLLRAAVHEHRERGITYRTLATFLVKSIAKFFLPPELSQQLIKTGTPARQIFQLDQRLRRTATRHPA